MADHRLDPRGVKPGGERETLQTVGGVAAWGPAAAGGVTSVVGGSDITVDSTDPAHPVISSAFHELLMADGVTSPPVPIETEAGDDWLYQD